MIPLLPAGLALIAYHYGDARHSGLVLIGWAIGLIAVEQWRKRRMLRNAKEAGAKLGRAIANIALARQATKPDSKPEPTQARRGH